MPISNVTMTPFTPNWQNTVQQRKQDFNQLAQALQAGDLAGAQQAYANLETLLPQNQTTNSNANPIQNDFASLGKALASGNLNQAQSDFSQLQTDLKSAYQNAGAQGISGVHHGHHHHHHSSDSQDAASNNPADATQTNSAGGTNVNVLA